MCPEDGAALRLREGPQDPVVGRVIKGRYRVLRKVGAGGMGVVYLAEQIAIGRPVALKLLHREFATDDQLVRRFIQEARIAASLRHRNVVIIHDFDQGEDGSLFLAMEYLEGQTLSQMIRREGPLPVGRALGFAVQIGEGLRAAHRAGVIHRDVKPQNIMVVEGDEVKLLDFGIARLRDAGGPHLTRSGAALGTPAYMAPEQIEGQEATERTDIYAFGSVLYEMLTGAAPFTAPSAAAVLAKHLHGTPVPLRARRPDVPAGVERVVMHALEKDPAARQGEMGQVLAGLRDVDGPPGGRGVRLAAEAGGFVADSFATVPRVGPDGGPESVGAPATHAALRRPARPPWKRLGLASGAMAVAAAAVLVVRSQGISFRKSSDPGGQRSPGGAASVTVPRIDRPPSPDDGETGRGKPPPLPSPPAARPVTGQKEASQFAPGGPKDAPQRAQQGGPSIPSESLPGSVAEKGMDRPSQLRVHVEQSLQSRGLLKGGAAGGFGVTVETRSDGIVTLTGVLRSGKEKEEAIRVAKQVPGVLGVRQKINVAESWKIESD